MTSTQHELSEFMPLNRKAILTLLAQRLGPVRAHKMAEKRKAPRWPFRGTVELWIPNQHRKEEYRLATCQDLSINGVGVRSDEPLPIGATVNIAVHQPEVTFHGKAIVQHCKLAESEYNIGLRFVFGPELVT